MRSSRSESPWGRDTNVYDSSYLVLQTKLHTITTCCTPHNSQTILSNPNLHKCPPPTQQIRGGGTGGSRVSPRERRRRRRRDHPRGIGAGRLSTGDDDERSQVEEGGDSDHNMADVSPNSSQRQGSRRRKSPRYRLRRDLLLKRAKGGNGGGAAAAAAGGRGNVPQDVPRVPLAEVVGVYSGGPSGRRDGEAGHDPVTYELFVNLVERMLDQRPETR